jgi:biotin carboxyl carrier protein
MKQFKFTINKNNYHVTVNKVEDTIAEVEVNGISYTVLMDKPAKKQAVTFTRPAQTLTTNAGAPAASHPAENVPVYVVKSPLPGMILNIDCKVGDEVKKGQNLLVLEAMKMENSIPADHDGKIIEIKVQQGDSVMENAELVVIK